MLPSIPLSVLKACQSTGYQILEDMHRLYNHPIVQQEEKSQVKYLQLVNRKSPNKRGEPSTIQDIEFLHTRFRITGQEGLQQLLYEARQLLHDFDNPDLLPPPLWLRMLPVCCSIILDTNLFAVGEKPIFRWIAFNIDVPDINKSSALSHTTVNINNNTKAEIELISPAKNLSLVFYEYLRSPKKPRTMPSYTSWGIRFRTTEDADETGHWADIKADVDNFKTNESRIPELVAAKVSAPVYPFPQSPTSIDFVKEIIHEWAGLAGPQEGTDKSHPTHELSAYCQTLQQFYPQECWPSAGVDSLLCPSLVWSPEPNVLGAAATIFWGFEGHLTEEQCDTLLQLSQILMASTPLYINNPQIKESAQLRGKTDYLHKIPSHVGALISKMEEFEEKWKEFAANHPKLRDIPPFDATAYGYVAAVSTMFLVADTECRYRPLPDMAPIMLSECWNNEMLEEFSNLLVWPLSRERVVTSNKIKDKLEKYGIELKGGIRAVDKVKPEISVENNQFLVSGSRGLYPIFWYVLDSALQHSAVYELIYKQKGQISIKYETHPEQRIIVANSGEPPTGQPQNGWDRDLAIIKNLRDPLGWQVVRVNGEYSVYENGVWVTIIERENEERLP